MLTSEEQPLNAKVPILVTLSGIAMLVSEVQVLNSLFPMLFKLWGSVMLSRLEQPKMCNHIFLLPHWGL